jgi:hypothetical protein
MTASHWASVPPLPANDIVPTLHVIPILPQVASQLAPLAPTNQQKPPTSCPVHGCGVTVGVLVGVSATVTVGVSVAVAVIVLVAVGVLSGVCVAVAVVVLVATGVGLAGRHVAAVASFARNLLPSPVPLKVMQYVLVPPSSVSTTLIDAAPLGTASGAPFPTALRRPLSILATFTKDGPLGAAEFLYLKRVVAPLLLQLPFGRTRGTGPPPLLNLNEESAP